MVSVGDRWRPQFSVRPFWHGSCTSRTLQRLDSRSVRESTRPDGFLPEKRKVDSSILSLTT